jgi:hypothetical protein
MSNDRVQKCVPNIIEEVDCSLDTKEIVNAMGKEDQKLKMDHYHLRGSYLRYID